VLDFIYMYCDLLNQAWLHWRKGEHAEMLVSNDIRDYGISCSVLDFLKTSRLLRQAFKEVGNVFYDLELVVEAGIKY